MDGDLAPHGSPDGQLNAADLLIMTRILQGEITATPIDLQNGDLYPPGSPDGVITVSDLLLLYDLVHQAGQGTGTPVAANDPAAAATPEDTAVTTLNVLANDTLVDNAVISTFDAISANSTLVNVSSNGDGTFDYIPPVDFNGTDSFTYTLIDDQGDTSTATVTITVTAVNDIPVAKADDFSVAEDGSLSGNVLADNGNGSDSQGDTPVTVSLASINATNGNLTLNTDGSFDYTPNPNFDGTDSFSYTLTDSTPETSNEATVTLTVTAVNDIPVANPDSFTVAANGTLNGNVLADNGAGADDPGDVPVNVTTGSTSTGNGNLSLNPDGSFTYTPNLNFTGSDSFSYTLTDSTPEVSNEAIVTITVTDTTPPSVVLTSPANGDSVTGTVVLDAAATDDVGIASVQFVLDGTNLGLADTVAPFSVSWDTGTSANGSHALTAIARDLSGNQSTSGTVIVTVSSSGASDPAVIGQWSAQIVNLPTVAVNLILLHTGKLLFWAGDFATAPNFGELWDPATNQITPVPNPFSNIFCSANIGLADGRILVAGGHDVQTSFLGIADVNTFDPVTETWTSLPPMSFRRWYPTLTALGDGRAIAVSGSETSESVFVTIPEIYDPVANTWTQLSGAPMSIPLYPMMYLLPDGRLLQSGAADFPTNTKVLDIDTQLWTIIDSNVLEAGSGVMYSPGRIMKSGSASNDGETPTAPSSATTYVLDMNGPSPAWRETISMTFARTYHNLTSLPDGSVLASSGSRVKSLTNLAPAVLEAELWSPATETWTTMAPMQTPRVYHSTAVLLPDGRVAVSGSGNISGATDMLNLEVYSPPYLFKGPRPVVTSVASQLTHGSNFTVQTPDAADISAVNLVRLGAATHGFDQNQRFVPLSFTPNTGALDVQAPTSANLVPPGYYMLFLINSSGVPSVARFVRFPAGYEDSEPPGPPGNLTAMGSVATVSLSWDAAFDNGGISNYEVHRAATSGFIPSGTTLVGQPTATNFTDTGLPGGSYFYIIIAVDIAGNTGPASNEVAITVSGDLTLPSVALTNPVDSSLLSGIVPVTADASDNVGIAGVQFMLDGVPLGSEDTVEPYSYSWDTVTTPNGPHVLTAVARDASGNTAGSAAASVTVTNTQVSGLVAAWGFEEGNGSSTADASGNGNTGTISGAGWTSNGRFGNALSFDGVNDWLTVADANSLDLTNEMTLEAWVYPTALSSGRTVIMKETAGQLAYTLSANDDALAPAGLVRISGNNAEVLGNGALSLNTWTHLAVTYDGTVLRLYENGTEVGTTTTVGTIEVSTQPLRIGGNQIWGEYFSGRIDEVRIYNRALDAAELQIRMNIPVVTPQPTRSSPITVDPIGRRVWLVNPDNDSVAVIGADSLLLEQEISVGAHPSGIALDKFGQLWVTCQEDDSVWILDATSGAVLKVLTLPWGSAPVAIVFSPNGLDGYISASGSGLIQQVNAASQALSGTLDVGTTPRALAVTADGQKMLAVQFISTDSTAGMVRSIDLSAFSVNGILQLPLDASSLDGPLAGRGLPNYLAGIAIHPQNSLAWIGAKKDNILRGIFRDGQPLTFETTVRSMIGQLNLDLNVENTDQRLDIDNHGQPSAIAISESGENIFVTMQGNNRLLVLNQLGAEITRVDTGLAPQGVVIDPVSKRVFTKDLMSRTVTVFDATGLLTAGASTLPQLSQIQTVSNESMSSAVLLGKQIFYNAADTRMARDGYISCAVCHLDGGHDGRVWDFTDRGEGLRNTITLNGQGGSAGAPLHWTGNFDEVQDFENDIRNAFGGSGFMNDTDFLAGTRSDPLGDPKAGISLELDALAAYVDSLTRTGRSPRRLPDGNMTTEALAGQALFTSLGCPACHSGVRFSDSNTGVRHDVGTIKPASGQRRGASLDGFDTPKLTGLWANAPYLHDGSAASLLDVLTTANPTGLHDNGVSSLTPTELNQLVEYLLQLELP